RHRPRRHPHPRPRPQPPGPHPGDQAGPPGGRPGAEAAEAVAAAVTVLRNVLALLFTDPIAGWRRDFGSFAPALASMTLVLALGGVVGVLAYTATSAFEGQLADASVIHAYLADQDQADVDSLMAKLKADPRVSSVTFISKEEA